MTPIFRTQIVPNMCKAMQVVLAHNFVGVMIDPALDAELTLVERDLLQNVLSYLGSGDMSDGERAMVLLQQIV